MPNAVRIYAQGDSDQLKYEAIDSPQPGAGEVALSQSAVGLNFIDVYHRSGQYPITDFPAIIGLEGAGTVMAVGSGVTTLKEGDRVAYAAPPMGAYADERVMPAQQLVKLPDDIAFDIAAAMMLQGMTVQYLIRQTYQVSAGETVLLHAAAGGIGLIACQWLKHLGVNIIGTVGSDEKAELAKAHGCDHIIQYRSENIAERVRDITDGRGVPVVYDSIGISTLEASLDSLSPRGMMVSFGAASGPIDAFNIGMLAAKGSLYLTRPTLMTYTADPENMQKMAHELFELVLSGVVKININQRYSLADAAKAHDDLEGRKTTGSTIFET
ncbi:MAG: quinone oxidoreductase [Granulosicoccus sp.]|nr:quinone oxidoreductase [Granulosicoccus sp.]